MIKSLALAVNTALLATLATTAHANDAKKPIGDLEIYKAAEGGKVTIMMMLDTSGSMTDRGFLDGEACDMPAMAEGRYDYKPVSGRSNTTPSYATQACEVNDKTKKLYSALYVPHFNVYYTCNAKGTCNTSSYTRGKPAGYDRAEKDSENVNIGGTRYPAYKVYRTVNLTTAEKNALQADGGGLYREDRLTRLKHAIFALMDSKDLDPKKVAIGIGQFSTQSDSFGRTISSDGRTGKILVPAALLDQAQRDKIKAAVAKLVGSGGTPASAAYAEAGAYVLGETTQTGIANTYSGFHNSVGESKQAGKYISTIDPNAATCDGQGIYFLTDGEPNSSVQPVEMMKKALGSKGSTFSVPTAGNGTLPNGSQSGHGMPEAGAFAKALRVASNNPKNTSIRTAVVGFGSVFDTRLYEDKAKGISIRQELAKPEIDKDTSMPITSKPLKKETGVYFNCNLIPVTKIDARNACNWGAKSHPSLPGVGGYGEGGFYSAQSTQDVIDSVKTFLGDLNTKIPSTPTGVITVPDDPYSVSAQQAVAYLPMMDPKVATNDAVWPGNLKKYQLRNGTVWGVNGQRLFRDTTGALNDNVQDEWSTTNTDNGNITTGGFYAQLVAPDSGTQNVRTLYIEDFTSATNQTPIMRKFGVNAGGKITLDDQVLSNSVTFNDRNTYTPARVKFLLHFLGFTNFKANEKETNIQGIDDIKNDTNLANIVLTQPDTAIRVLGASPHSAPTAVSYGATLDDNGNVVASPDNDYVIFGSMDGALHMANANSGAERFAFIPKRMLTDDGADGQIHALKDKNTVATIAQPKFGVDAPWLVSATYDYQDKDKDGTPEAMQTTEDIFAYGGLRMGGDGLYALNLGTDRTTAPTLAFVHTPSSAGFARLGQVWTRPTKAKILMADTPTDVLIFGGGYDMCYENENFQVGVAGETYKIANDQRGVACSTKTGADSTAIGNALYMINATTGELIWSTSNVADNTAPATATNTVNANIRHSIVGGVNTIDRNGDGYVDAIYFADLGGQIFRADAGGYTNGVPNRVTRLLAPADEGTKYVRRFYDKPVVSVYQDGSFNRGRRFVLVNATTGDRSNPISKMRELDNAGRAETHADRVYGLIDTDIGARNAEFYGDNVTLNVQDVSDDELESLAGITGSNDAEIAAAKTAKINEVKSKRGWYYPLTYFDGYTNVRYSKGVGKSEVIGSLLFSSVYNPDKTYGSVNSCSASVIGGSEYQMYCLPWGVCSNADSQNGHGGFLPAGQGISELTLGPTDNSAAGRNRRVLISSVALGDGTAVSGRIGYNTGVAGSTVATKQGLRQGENTAGGSGSMPRVYFDPRFVLQPLRWYDNSIKNN